ncbi:HD domain-containing protein [Nocardia amikacinitolerans]|uniref:HD domain-containing protein n=1 Tax=Nocardia amikacinitolerans TaxID=756689 RepID=UPI003673E07A
MSGLVSDAKELAQTYLAEDLPRRWSHVSGVARQGARIAPAFSAADGEVLVAACWLHDIGYAPSLAATGFHPLDGAVFLRDQGWDGRLCSLVAHHSCAVREAKLRRLDQQLAQFHDEGSPLRDALWYCDMTTSPDGEAVTVDHRLSEILERYGAGSLVFEFISEARPELLDSVVRTEDRVRNVVQPM